DRLAALAAKGGLETRDSPGVLRLAHRRHHAARFLHRRVDAGDILADDLGRAVAEVLARAVVVVGNDTLAVDRDNDVRRALDQTLEVFLVQRRHGRSGRWRGRNLG